CEAPRDDAQGLDPREHRALGVDRHGRARAGARAGAARHGGARRLRRRALAGGFSAREARERGAHAAPGLRERAGVRAVRARRGREPPRVAGREAARAPAERLTSGGFDAPARSKDHEPFFAICFLTSATFEALTGSALLPQLART